MSTNPQPSKRHGNLVRLLKIEHASVYVPAQIRIKGQWLERLAGFRPGSLARVSVLAQGMFLVKQLP